MSKSHHISYDSGSEDLWETIEREHQLTGAPVSLISRRKMRIGDAVEAKQQSKVLPLFRYDQY